MIVLALFAIGFAQGAPKKSQASAAPAQQVASNQGGQKDAAAKKSGTHSNNMIGNHKDVMTADANKNQGSGSHGGNAVGNHKDVMGATADNNQGSNSRQPNTIGNHKDVMTTVLIDSKARTQAPTAPAASPAANPTPAPAKAAKSDHNPPR